ncbi:phytanoyl-CoA dioxygenase [Brevundimonas sp. LM2]|uniref:phytanoyl-CoA dioxygenase family protein n=1 Tax=Brevundimonas sp. LM2 TaxID=1938605 RepID=UPI000983DCF6|nr:phytanoyl-CoA dioxygenase family protein [Brevundimonas sp. LM2]AQR60878.1 phytanoyl-CoA dioxygenase [Brevundimonas sp. LM2]
MIPNRKNPLPGVPNTESPFFKDFFDPETTDPVVYDYAVQLNEKGFAIIDFPDGEIDAIADRIKRSLTGRYDWAAWRERGEGLRIQDAWKFDADVRRLAVNETILQMLTQLYGRQAWPFQTLNFPVGTQQHYHTDSVHFSSMPERFMCGVWIPLEDVELDQGPLIYYPGSHKWPIYTNEHIGHRHSDRYHTSQTVYEYMWERLVEASGIEPTRLAIKKGQALIWSANLLHGGDVQTNRDKTRWSQVTHYYFDDCAYYTPMNSDVPAGVIDFRRPFNIITGKESDNFYIGQKVPEDFIDVTNPLRVKAGGFDGSAYLRANPDVAAVGEDPLEHWLKHGRAEGRLLRPVEET